MPKSAGQKGKLLALLRILTEETDEGHALSLERIQGLLLGRYGIRAERKSLYDDFEVLRSFGHDVIAEKRGGQTGYYLGSRMLEEAEWKLLVDAIQSSRLLTEKKSTALTRKLLCEASTHQREKLCRQVYVANRWAVGNEQVLYTVDALHEAISGNRKIRFAYEEYTTSGQKVLRHGGKIYTVSPWALCWDDEFYYLISYDSEEARIRHFRVDRLSGVVVTEEGRDGKETFAHFDMGRYSRAVFGMFGGEMTSVTLSCADRLCGVIFDRFGKETLLRPQGDGRFLVTVHVMISPIFLSWVLGFGKEMKILSPQGAADALCQMAKDALGQYEETETE